MYSFGDIEVGDIDCWKCLLFFECNDFSCLLELDMLTLIELTAISASVILLYV
jgi:hypothetical protein